MPKIELVEFCYSIAAIEYSSGKIPKTTSQDGTDNTVYERAKYHYNTIIVDCIPDSGPGLWPALPAGAGGVQGAAGLSSNVLGAISTGLSAVPGAGPLAPAILAVIQQAFGAAAGNPPIATTGGGSLVGGS